MLVKGGDYTIEGVVGADLVQAAGGRVVLVEPIEGRSTTRLIEAIRTSQSPDDAATDQDADPIARKNAAE